MNKIFTIAVLGSLFILSSCNTMQGLGQDIRKAGQSISDASS